jgi:hypothetical protein
MNISIKEEVSIILLRCAVNCLIDKKYNIIEDYNNGVIDYATYSSIIQSIDDDISAISGDINF